MHCVFCRYYNTIRIPYIKHLIPYSQVTDMGERKSKSSPYMLFIDEQVDEDYCFDKVCNLISV